MPITLTPNITPGSWYYATKSDVEDAISVTGLTIASNMENTSTLANDDRIIRAGTFADAWMDGRLKVMGFTTPVSLSNANDVEILRQVSVYLVLLQLGRWRVVQTIDPAGNAYSTLKKLGEEWYKAAEDILCRIDNGNILLSATRSMTMPQSNATSLDSTGVPINPQYLPGFGWPWLMVI
jgi:hypothetical protein